MKPTFLPFVLVFVMLSACYTPYTKLKVEQKNYIDKHIEPFNLSKALDNKTALFYINSQNVKEIQNTMKGKDDRLFIIFFNWWCGSFEEKRERIVSLAQSNSNIIPLYITSDDFKYYSYYQEKYQNILNSDIYMIDVLKYGNGKRNPHKRQEPFVEEICPECVEKMGFPTLIVFDGDKNLLYNSTGLDSLEFIQLQDALKP